MRHLIIFCLLWGLYICANLYYGDNKYWVPVPELLFVILTLFLIERLWNKKVIKYISMSLSMIFICIFLLQDVYYAKSGEFISSLALENLNQAYLIMKPVYVVLIIGIFICGISYNKFVANYPSKIKLNLNMKILIGLLYVVSIFVIILQNGYAFANNKISNIISYPTPVVSLGTNVKKFFSRDNSNVTGYPFMKDWVYKTDLVFARTNYKVTNPNVIIIFTEGTSARLLGCYGGRFPELTPNIDDFSQSGMLVKNYFNHTAATFRGTHGQLASCYPRYGGFEKGGWAMDGAASSLSMRKYQTLPNVLNNTYDTIFISPHVKSDPYTDMAQMLKFKQIYVRDDMQNILGYEPSLASESIKDNDMYKSIIQLLKQRSTNKPFLLAFYTFGTHADLDVSEDGVVYNEWIKSNASLNTIHNCDAAFGAFWNYFLSSPYKDNTIIIFTADHAHFHDKAYLEAVDDEEDYKKIFFDKIPLIIYDPIHQLPHEFDANDSTSLDLTPTVLQLLDINNVENSFMGKSIFDSKNNDDRLNLAVAGYDFYGIYNHTVYPEKKLDMEQRNDFKRQKNVVLQFYKYEHANKVFK